MTKQSLPGGRRLSGASASSLQTQYEFSMKKRRQQMGYRRLIRYLRLRAEGKIPPLLVGKKDGERDDDG